MSAAVVTPGVVVLEITAPSGPVTVIVVVPLAFTVVTVVSLDVFCEALLPDAAAPPVESLPADASDERSDAPEPPLPDPILADATPADATLSMAFIILSAAKYSALIAIMPGEG
jgi:hypothetical protein